MVECSDSATMSRDAADLTAADVIIEFTSGAGGAACRTAALEAIQAAVQASYGALLAPALVEFETVALLDELTKNRVTSWLRAYVRQPDDAAQAPVAAESRLEFAARGSLSILDALRRSRLRVENLRKALNMLAAGISSVKTEAPALWSSARLMEAVRAWQQVKDRLRVDDRARFITLHGFAEVDLGTIADIPPEELLETRIVNRSADMILVVGTPDYECTGEWLLKHGGAAVRAVVAPGTLLDRFYRRELDIRPGDALHCRVDIETAYGPDYEVLSERLKIGEILEILPAVPERAALLRLFTAPAGQGDEASLKSVARAIDEPAE